MRHLPYCLAVVMACAAIPGCALAPAIGPLLGLEGASILALGRGVGDIGISAYSGRDCSIVRLDQGLTYCAPQAPAPEADLYCTRTLATPDCWTSPDLLPGRRLGIADTPPLTPAQERYRTARWPKSLFAE